MHQEILDELREIRKLLQLSQPVLSLRQFCKFADISEDYAYKLTSSRLIKHYKPFGKKIYVDREIAIQLLRQNPVNSSQETTARLNNYLLTSKTNQI